MSITLNPDDLQVTTFAANPGDEGLAPAGDTTACEPESAPTRFPSCNSACWTACCGTYNGCTSPGYNC